MSILVSLKIVFFSHIHFQGASDYMYHHQQPHDHDHQQVYHLGCHQGYHEGYQHGCQRGYHKGYQWGLQQPRSDQLVTACEQIRSG